MARRPLRSSAADTFSFLACHRYIEAMLAYGLQCRRNVEAAEVEDQENIDHPKTDAIYRGERLNDFFVLIAGMLLATFGFASNQAAILPI
jgi:hypothetical protein